MNSTVLASGGSGLIAGSLVAILSYILTFWHITLPPDVVTAITVVVYFLGHLALGGKLSAQIAAIPAPTAAAPVPMPAAAPAAPTPTPQPMASPTPAPAPAPPAQGPKILP